MRIALFGGSFDPPHLGHTAIAQAAADAFQLDRVLFAPVGRQPLKDSWPSAPFADRIAMVTAACAIDLRFTPSALDAPRSDGEPNYTVDTVEQLRRDWPSAHLYNLAGVDSFLTLPQWHEPKRLLSLTDWIVVSRPGSSLRGIDALDLTDTERARIHTIEGILEDFSSTELRRRLEVGQPTGDLLDPSVALYICKHRLYR